MKIYTHETNRKFGITSFPMDAFRVEFDKFLIISLVILLSASFKYPQEELVLWFLQIPSRIRFGWGGAPIVGIH